MSDLYATIWMSVVGLFLIVILTARAIYVSLYEGHELCARCDLYEDADGSSTREAIERFGFKRIRFVILLSSALGFCMATTHSLLIASSSGTVESGKLLAVLSWMLILVQSFAVFTERRCIEGFNLGLGITVSSICLLLSRLGQTTLSVQLPSSDFWLHVSDLVELTSIFALALSGISVPRRPDVFCDGRLVDRELTQSALARLTWSWPSDLTRIAAKKNSLDLEDLPRPSHHFRAQAAVQEWKAHSCAGESVWRSILRTHARAFLWQWCAALLAAAASIAPQWVVLQFLRSIERRREGTVILGAWTWVLCIGCTMLAQTWTESYVFWVSRSRLGLPVRAQLSSLIFRKSLLQEELHDETPTSEARWEEKLEEHSPGQDTVNLIGVDVKRIADFCDVNSDIPRSVVKLMLSLVLLSSLLGWYPLLAGFGAILVFTPINYLFSKREASIQTALMRARESKTAAILQVLRGIRQIKFTALESAWEVTIEALRERELTLIWASYMNNILLTGCWIATPILLAAVSLSTYAIVHEEFSPSVAFVSLAVFESLEVTLSAIPGVMTAMLDAWVSVLRIDDYLQRPERLSELVRESDQVVLDNVSVPRSNGIQEPLNGSPGLLFKSLSLAFPAGELSIISGPTGVGKSMLLKAILGEVRVRDGRIKLPELPMKTGTWITPGAIAYVAQTPWLENTTIKNNILFGLPYHHVRYLQTIQACALESDLQVLTDGDETQVGAGGSILSGGQRWRVTLARAMYSRAELLVMDDIFSALDPHVGWHILQHCLTGELGAGRTRIVATHHSELCSPKARLLVELKADGTYVESLFSGPSEEKRIDLVAHQIEFGVLHNAETPCHLDNDKSAYVRSQTRTSAQQELTETGAVKWKVYLTFVKASGGLTFWIGAVVLFVAVQLVVVFRSWWVKLWTATSQSVSGHNLLSGMIYQQGYPLPSGFHAASSQPHNDSSTFSTTTYLSVYIALAISTSVFGVIKQYYVLTGSIKASRRLFATINSVILHAPLQWLEDVPLGRILNRMTSDFSGLETGMPYAIIYLATALLNLFSIVGVSISASPVIICFIFICLATCVWFTSVYLSVARPLKRLESATRSPIFDQFNSALTGVVTIRSFGQSASYVALMDDKLDDLTVTSWYLLLFKGWISLRIGSVGSVFASLVAAIILLMPGIDASLAGFIMAATLELSGYIMAIIQRYANMELEMNAAERIVEYCDIPTENPGGQLPPAAWPMNGLVEVEDLVVGYSDLKPVLDGITFSIQPGERLGVVGRTGAGKSTLALALLRLVEATRGSIRIDGLDISKLTLQSLRSRVAIIPQDPVLFTGTVRSNLDPFNSHDDYELKNALDQISLAPDLQGASPSDAHNYKQQWFHLSSPIFEGGVNLSQGQRQLLCLARLIIMPSKVIIMDEATSAIDMETDEVMQRSIRESFTNSTLIVIAHRLSTVADFDKILVLDEGRVVEFGTPRELWERGVHHGKFRGMCERSGERDHLEQVIYNGGAM